MRLQKRAGTIRIDGVPAHPFDSPDLVPSVTGEAMVTAVDLDGCTVRLYFDGAEDAEMKVWARLLGKQVSITALADQFTRSTQTEEKKP